MSKSVYSIVLDDAVVEAVDELAYRLATNRSALINSILAERVSLVTPEQRRKTIIDTVEDAISQQNIFRILQSDNNLMIKSAFKYKYNPSVNYTVVLHKGSEYLGELRVNFRTRNDTLLNELDNFLHLWVALEKKYTAGRLSRSVAYTIERGKYTRQLAFPDKNITEEETGALISDYIKAFDKIMKLYFAGNNAEETEKEFINWTYLRSGDL